MRHLRLGLAAALTAVLAVVVPLAAVPAAAAPVPLPRPAAPGLVAAPQLQLAPDRLRTTVLPAGARATDTERVAVGLGPSGDPVTVSVEQRLHLSGGTGDYVVIDRGPVRAVRALDDTQPPTLKLGAVLYAGYVPPAGRDLATLLTLDPLLEQARLPLVVVTTFTPRGSTTEQPLLPGGRVPGPGQVTVSLVNASATQVPVPDALLAPAPTAAALELLRGAAATPGPRPPVAGDGLPDAVPATGTVGERTVQVSVPLLVTGTLTGGALTGPGTSPDGTVTGTLSDRVDLHLAVERAGSVALDLTAVPVLDPRLLAPPRGVPTWPAWAAAAPPVAEMAAASRLLLEQAATAAAVRDVSPYLTTDLVGETRTTLHLTLAPAPTAARSVTALHPRGAPLALVGGLALLAVAGLELLRRRL